MFDLLITIYDFDPFRFGLWDALAALNLDGIVAWVLDLAGFQLWEDFSISK